MTSIYNHLHYASLCYTELMRTWAPVNGCMCWCLISRWRSLQQCQLVMTHFTLPLKLELLVSDDTNIQGNNFEGLIQCVSIFLNMFQWYSLTHWWSMVIIVQHIEGITAPGEGVSKLDLESWQRMHQICRICMNQIEPVISGYQISGV